MTQAGERANLGLIGAIVAVATIGGLLFGYDSGAVNGTQAGLTAEFGVGFTGWQVDMKRARSGALLSPQAITEGDLLPGARIAGAASFVEEALTDGTQALVY